MSELEASLAAQETLLRSEASAAVAAAEAKAFGELASLQAQHDAQDAVVERLQQQLVEKDDEIGAVQEQLKQAQAERDALAERGADAAQFQRAADAAQARIVALQTEINRGELQHSEDVHQLETTNATLRRDLRTARGELELREAAVEDARTRLKQYQESHAAQREDYIPVSYTHLTLPTIYSV